MSGARRGNPGLIAAATPIYVSHQAARGAHPARSAYAWLARGSDRGRPTSKGSYPWSRLRLYSSPARPGRHGARQRAPGFRRPGSASQPLRAPAMPRLDATWFVVLGWLRTPGALPAGQARPPAWPGVMVAGRTRTGGTRIPPSTGRRRRGRFGGDDSGAGRLTSSSPRQPSAQVGYQDWTSRSRCDAGGHSSRSNPMDEWVRRTISRRAQ